jgi:L-rhamnose mutarotase
MEVTLGCEEELEKRHNPIWQDLIDVFAQHGVHKNKERLTENVICYIYSPNAPTPLRFCVNQ